MKTRVNPSKRYGYWKVTCDSCDVSEEFSDIKTAHEESELHECEYTVGKDHG